MGKEAFPEFFLIEFVSYFCHQLCTLELHLKLFSSCLLSYFVVCVVCDGVCVGDTVQSIIGPEEANFDKLSVIIWPSIVPPVLL